MLPLRSTFSVDFHFRTDLNPRKFLTASHLDSLRELFPKAVGVQIFVSGFLVVLFKSMVHVAEAYRTQWPLEVGSLHVVFDVMNIQLATEPVTTGFQVAVMPDAGESAGCLGLKLRMPQGQEVITTVTHGFVKRPDPLNALKYIGSWILSAKEALRRFRSPRPQPQAPAIGMLRKPPSGSPIGKVVWLVGGNRKIIGTITHTYDRPSRSLPYLQGYLHDLSLTTDTALPEVSSPPGYPRITEWASYSEALSGSRVYAVRLNASAGVWRVIDGTLDTSALRNATVCGTQYMWDTTYHTQNACILWRTSEPASPADSWSGSVLCLGKPSDPTSQAIMFQNFQIPCTLHETDPRTAKQKAGIIKGDFVLPSEIRASEILTGEGTDTWDNFNSAPMRFRDVPSEERRSVSSP
ncbi:hypothetical protein VTN77DRAFT_6558 [Rasamsonia byssochlamydoides]|uniref:uncharacterized protein n=1 Tax=Rasamsonia byssochlamydoides TaxID=89139 RepID=UPI003743FE79